MGILALLFLLCCCFFLLLLFFSVRKRKTKTYFYDPFLFLFYFNGWSERENGIMTDEIGGGLFFFFT